MLKRGVFFMALAVTLAAVSPAFATNGDNLIGVGPISRAMGGVGVAAPQDSISAVFANPAGMCLSSYCNASTFDFAGTMFMPKVDSKIVTTSHTYSDDSKDYIYSIPAIGISVPITDPASKWRFGIAAYGVSGLGVDYRGSKLDTAAPEFGGYPLAQGTYTSVMIMKFAPALAVQATDKLSLGAAVHIDYSTLDLQDGSSPGYGYGYQLGALFAPVDNVKLGASYTSAQNVNHRDVMDADPTDGFRNNLELEQPQQLNLGVAYTVFKPAEVMVEADARWINWSGAKGYKDFDWNDQWVYAIGVQAKPAGKLTLRAGFNYAKNPVEDHTIKGMTPVNVQGMIMPSYYYETFRIVGFPAIVEKHVTFGVGYAVSPKFSVNAGYMHAMEETMTETGMDVANQPVEIQSTLSESSFDFGMTWTF